MREEPKIVGGVPADAREEIAGVVRRWREEGREPVEGELEKNEDELRMIDVVNRILQARVAELGIRVEPIDPDRYHFLNEHLYAKVRGYREGEAHAFADNRVGALYVNVGAELKRIDTFWTLLHESIHLLSHVKFRSTREGQQMKIDSYRSGYEVLPEKPEESPIAHFRGFNELVTEWIAVESSVRGKELLESELGLTEDDLRSLRESAYFAYWDVFKKLCGGIGAYRGESWEKVAGRISRGYFTGEMMHLRDVERIYGEGALRVLAFLGRYYELGETDREGVVLVEQFFGEKDRGRREQIAGAIEKLSERQMELFQRMVRERKEP